MELSDYRQQIDGIDSQLLALFYQRMEVAAHLADEVDRRRRDAVEIAAEHRVRTLELALAALEAVDVGVLHLGEVAIAAR